MLFIVLLRLIVCLYVFYFPFQGGWTALHIAAFFNQAQVLDMLLDDPRLDVSKSTGVGMEGSILWSH